MKDFRPQPFWLPAMSCMGCSGGPSLGLFSRCVLVALRPSRSAPPGRCPRTRRPANQIATDGASAHHVMPLCFAHARDARCASTERAKRFSSSKIHTVAFFSLLACLVMEFLGKLLLQTLCCPLSCLRLSVLGITLNVVAGATSADMNRQLGGCWEETVPEQSGSGQPAEISSTNRCGSVWLPFLWLLLLCGFCLGLLARACRRPG